MQHLKGKAVKNRRDEMHCERDRKRMFVWTCEDRRVVKGAHEEDDKTLDEELMSQ